MIVVYKELKNNKLELTKEEFEEYLEKARKEGYDEGYKEGLNSSKLIPNIQPITVPPTPSPINPFWCDKPMCKVSNSDDFKINETVVQNDNLAIKNNVIE